MTRRRLILLDCILLFLFAAALIKPLFKAKYLDKWGSIESTFISDARYLAAHWPHPQWQPLWYGGTRFDYIYPPALRYGTAAIAKTIGYWPVKAYHVYTAFFYALGIAGVYFFVQAAAKSRAIAWMSAVGTALLSPSFLFLAHMRHDAWKRIPVRLGVLVKYGEGPHMTALALIPIALGFAWLAFERRRPAATALAAVFCAAVVSNNFYGATALAIFYPILVWSFWITRGEKRMLVQAAIIPVLAYGLTAFWLVPSYVRVTLENMQYVSGSGNAWSASVAVLVAGAYGMVSSRYAAGKPQRTWAVFAGGSAVFYSLNVLGNHFLGFRVMGEPGRLIPELDLVYILLAATVLAWLWNTRRPVQRVAALLVVLGALYSAKGYVRHAWEMFPLDRNYQSRVEYKVTDWLWRNLPEARALPIGSVRFWYDAWHDLNELGGGSDQGVLNGEVERAQGEIILGPKPEPAILWMQCLGVDAAYVSDKNSAEMFHDYLFPHKYDGVLPVIYDDGAGNRIYRVPRRYPERVRVVETARLNAARKPRFNDDVESLRLYADALEKGPDAAPVVTRERAEVMRIQAKVGAGQSVVVQESYDPAWHAWANGKALAVRKDALGQMAIDAPPGDQNIMLAFVTPLENQVGKFIFAIAALAVLGLIAMGAGRARAA